VLKWVSLILEESTVSDRSFIVCPVCLINSLDVTGITNHDEYSLVREPLEDTDTLNRENFGTLTLRRKKEERERERDAKMEQLRKKLKTDDESKYLILQSCPPPSYTQSK